MTIENFEKHNPEVPDGFELPKEPDFIPPAEGTKEHEELRDAIRKAKENS